MSSWLPLSDAGFDGFYLAFKTLIVANPTNYGLVSADGTALAADFTAYHAAYLAATQETTRSKATVQTKNNQKAVSLALVRGYAAQIRVNRAVSDALKINLGLHIADTAPTPVPVPSTKPVLAVAKIDQGLQQVRATDEATPSSRARAIGSAGMLVYRAVATTSVTDPTDATFLGFFGRPEFTNTFTSADRGKTATYFARWTNAKGEIGPWSQPVSAAIAA